MSEEFFMPLKTLHIFTELNGRGAAGEGGGEQPNDAEVILCTSSFKSFISDKHYTEEEGQTRTQRHQHWHWHMVYREGHRPIHKEGSCGWG